MEKVLLVAAGGAAGAVTRYALGVQALRIWGSAWPFGTFIANVSGGLLMGVLAGYLAHRGGADQERLRVLLGVGVLGGFTTFSAFSLETLLLVQRGAVAAATADVIVSIALCLLAASAAYVTMAAALR